MARNIIGIYRTHQGAAVAVDSLAQAGFPQAAISMLVTENTHGQHFAVVERTRAAEGVAAGGIAGGVIGGVAAGLTALASVTIPGIGLFAAGPLIAALTGVGAGATAGGLIGGLIGLGMNEHEAKLVEQELRRGGLLVGVHVEDGDQADQAKRVFRETGALNYS